MRLSEADINRFRDRITVAKRQQEDLASRFERYTNYYRGKHDIRIERPLDHVVVNYILPMVHIKVSALAAQPPVWRVVPRSPGAEARSLMWQEVLPYTWGQVGAHKQLRACLRDAKLYGYGVAKLGYRFETTKQMYYDLTPAEFAAARESKPDGVLLPVPSELLDLQGQYVARNPQALILYDDVFVERLSPIRFLPEPDIDWLNVQDAEYLVEQRVRTLEEVKRNPRYSGTRDLQGDRVWETGSKVPVLSGEATDTKDPQKARVTIWEIHDRRKGIIACFAESKREPLLITEMPYEFEGYGYEVLTTYEVPDQGVPMGDVQHAIPMQDEKNLVRSRAATRVRRFVDKYGLNEAAITDTTMEALKSDEEGAVVRLTGPVQGSVEVIRNTGFPQELQAHEANIDRDFSVVTRQPEYARATTQQGIETATEASILREMAGVSAQDDQAQWDEFQGRIGRKLKALIEQFYDLPRIARISQEAARQIQGSMEQLGQSPVGIVQEGQGQAWISFDRDTIRAEADVSVEAGSTAFRNRTLEQQRATAQFAPLWKDPAIDHRELVRLYITKATDFAAERDRLMAPEQPVIPGMPGVPGATPEGTIAPPSGTEEGLARAVAQVTAGTGG